MIEIQVGRLLDELDAGGQGINFFKLVVNPDDYGQTVENVFFVSFLISVGKAGIEVRKDGEIIISALLSESVLAKLHGPHVARAHAIHREL